MSLWKPFNTVVHINDFVVLNTRYLIKSLEQRFVIIMLTMTLYKIPMLRGDLFLAYNGMLPSAVSLCLIKTYKYNWDRGIL